MSKRLLFIHHGSVAGGAPLSMLYTMQGAYAAGYVPIAALRRPSPELHKLYNDAGFRTIETPWIPMFITWSGSEGKWWNPITWYGVFRAFKGWKSAKLKLQELVRTEKIDLVHLNSVGLSNCAESLMEIKFPFVWHVREHGPKRKGIRYRWISSTLAKAAHLIFLSHAERKSWLSRDDHGTVVHNFIDFDKFKDVPITDVAKQTLGISPATKVILYVGGIKPHKGILELLEALEKLVLKTNFDFVCLMPDSAIKKQGNPTKLEEKVFKTIDQKGLRSRCRLLPFNPNILDFFAACDVLVFPATKPHFARPVIEASAMGKPVIASNLNAIDELIRDGETGFLVNIENNDDLVNRLVEILGNPDLAATLGKVGKEHAREEFEFQRQMKKILSIYTKALQE